MWDSNAPLQLLKSMPEKLSKENLEKIQMVIDADKYKNSLISGFDLCGMYAPFCRGCKKTSIYPCALAYVNMKKAEGMRIEIDAKPVTTAENRIFSQPPVVRNPSELYEASKESAEKEIVAVPAVEEDLRSDNEEENIVEQVKDEQPVLQEPVAVEEPVKTTAEEAEPIIQSIQKPVKRKIRIAVARKKI